MAGTVAGDEPLFCVMVLTYLLGLNTALGLPDHGVPAVTVTTRLEASQETAVYLTGPPEQTDSEGV